MSKDFSPLVPGSKEYNRAKAARGEMYHFLSQNPGRIPRNKLHALRRMNGPTLNRNPKEDDVSLAKRTQHVANQGTCIIRGMLRSTYHKPKELYLPKAQQ